MHYNQILLADKWNESFEETIKLVARLQNDLNAYQQKENANQKIIYAKQLTINSIENFLTLTTDLIDEQKNMLQQQQQNHPQQLYTAPRQQPQLICDMPHSTQYLHNELMERMGLILDELEEIKHTKTQPSKL